MKHSGWLSWIAGLLPLVLGAVVFVGQIGFRNAILATDFRAYYTAGRMVLGGVRSDFYSAAVQYVWQQSWAPELADQAQLNPFRNPPFVAGFFAPFAIVPPELGFVLWSLVNLCLLGVVVRVAQHAVGECGPRGPRRALLMTVSFLPVVVTLLLGQLSLLLVLAMFLAWTAFRAGHDGRAGLALGLLLVRPQFLLLPVLVLLFQRRWRALMTLTVAGAAVLVLSLALVGWDGLLNYGQLLTGTLSWQDRYAIDPQRMHTWRGFLQLLLRTDDPAPVQPAWLTGIVVATLLTLAAWRGKWEPTTPRFDAQWALLVSGGLFVAPYANFHDLSMLLVAGVLAARIRLWLLPIVGYLSVLATQLSEPLLHVQISVLFMAGAVIVFAWQAWSSAPHRLHSANSRTPAAALEPQIHGVG